MTDEKGMLFDLRNGDSARSVECEHGSNEAAESGRATGATRKADPGALGAAERFKDLAVVIAAEGKDTGCHDVETDSEGPHVDFGSDIGQVHPQFGSSVVEGAQVVAQGGSLGIERSGVLRVAEVEAALVPQDVLQLDVLVHISVGVHGLDGAEQLAEQLLHGAGPEGLAAPHHHQLLQQGAVHFGGHELEFAVRFAHADHGHKMLHCGHFLRYFHFQSRFRILWHGGDRFHLSFFLIFK